MTKVAVLVGSLRKESYSKKIAHSVMKLFPEKMEVEIVEIGNLPLYNQDFDDHDQVPEEYTDFREKMKTMDAVLFVTPEYNRSMPGVLKNALDVGSRPVGESVYNGKPAAIISASIGAISGFGANHHLRQSLTFLNMPVVQQPEAYLASVQNLLDEDDNVAAGTLDFLQTVVDAFVQLMARYEL